MPTGSSAAPRTTTGRVKARVPAQAKPQAATRRSRQPGVVRPVVVVASAAEETTAEETIRVSPYHLPLAPARIERPSAPVDLGAYDEELRGWIVVFSRDVELGSYRDMGRMAEEAKAAATKSAEQQLLVLDETADWLARILLAWNFADGLRRPLPQPREGGSYRCPMNTLKAIMQAFGEATTPPKD